MKPMRTTGYSEIHREDLVAILRRNVPKYFSESDIADFRKFLSGRNWVEHDVFVEQDHGVVGCASFFLKSSSEVGLSWMFFSPYRIGSRRFLSELEEYLESIRLRVGKTDSELTFSLNTTPRVAKLLSRIGFLAKETAKDGYGPGYDRVRMEKRC
jgi:hypothetical protein